MLGMFARRDFLWSAAAATSAMAQRSGLSRKPNLIIFLADDLGCHDIGAWGATDLKTPNIDALAASGTRITIAMRRRQPARLRERRSLRGGIRFARTLQDVKKP